MAPKNRAAPELEEQTDTGILIEIPDSLKPRRKESAAVQATPAVGAVASSHHRMPDLGILMPLLRDPSITEIMVNDVRNIMIERRGKLVNSGVRIPNLEELTALSKKILDAGGRTLSLEHPYADLTLPDGSRVNLIGPPVTSNGICITLRKPPAKRFTLESLVSGGTMDARLSFFLSACVAGKANILFSGGTGSGKTALLNALAAYIGKDERIVTIEDTPELSIPHINSVKLQTQPQGRQSLPIPARELVANAMRMRPDRILVGECRRGEAFDMLQAMNTGHSGSMTTVHSNSTRAALTRLETLCLIAGTELPLLAIRKQIADALDLIVQIKRYRTGARKIVAVSQVTGMEGETILLQEIFASDPHDPAAPFRCTGFVPTFMDRMRDEGVDFPTNFFV